MYVGPISIAVIACVVLFFLGKALNGLFRRVGKIADCLGKSGQDVAEVATYTFSALKEKTKRLEAEERITSDQFSKEHADEMGGLSLDEFLAVRNAQDEEFRKNVVKDLLAKKTATKNSRKATS